jgi:hypothetical protein
VCCSDDAGGQQIGEGGGSVILCTALVTFHATFVLQVNVSWNSISSAGCGYVSEGINACRWLDEFKIGHNW